MRSIRDCARSSSFKPAEHNMLNVEIAETVFEPKVGGFLYDRGVGETIRRSSIADSDFRISSDRPSVQDQVGNANPHLNCPAAIVVCTVEGGGLVGRTYSNCRCVR
jgi:hypothetical protein